MNNCLYVFIDESGNLDFSSKGTKFFVLAAVTAREPLASSQSLQALKYSLLRRGIGGDEYQYFHASEDTQVVRDEVFNTVTSLQNINVNYLYAEKRKTHPKYQNEKFYTLLGSALVKYLLKVHQTSPYERVIIIFDQALTKKSQGGFLKAVKPELKTIGTPYAIYFHRTMSDFNGQIADYCAWAKYVSLERSEQRPINSLSTLSPSSFDIFANGDTYYY
jgi:hypothetical protein